MTIVRLRRRIKRCHLKNPPPVELSEIAAGLRIITIELRICRSID
jgi:hypothetical protein